jgi:hypothetical protein
MAERRYSDEQAREIFERAASDERLTPPRASERGFTLAELQSIGGEAGLEPERIAEAAASLSAQGGPLPRRTAWGLPVAVGRLVDLPRAPTDREWGMMVGELRATFGATGRASSQGNLREWSNGNLVVAIEPTESGYRLRSQTLKGSAMPLNFVGVGILAVGVFGLANGATDLNTFIMSAVGVGALIANYVRLPRWADTRERQMEYIAGRFGAILSERPKLEGPER